MNYALFLALNSSVEDVREELSTFNFGQEIPLVEVVEQVRTILGTLLDKHEVISVFEDLQELNNVRVNDLALIESFDRDLSTIDLQ